MRWLALLLIFPGALHAQEVVVNVRLEGVGEVLVLAEQDSAGLHLPARPVFELCGLPAPAEATLTTDELEERLRVAVEFVEQRQEVVISDRTGMLPATRAVRDAAHATAQARRSALPANLPGGFGASVAVDNDNQKEVLLSYGWGRASAAVGHNTVSGSSVHGGVSLRPLYLSAHWSEARDASVSARLLLGRSYAAVTVSEIETVASAGLLAGPVALFVSTTGNAAATIRLPQFAAIQVGYREATDRVTVRATYGRVPPLFNVQQIY